MGASMLTNKSANNIISQYIIVLIFALACFTNAYGASPAGYSEYYIPGHEEEMLRVFESIGAGSQGNTMHSIVTVTAWSSDTLVYYDHWEDGYDFDPDDPSTADVTIALANRGQSYNFESSDIPSNPRVITDIVFDGGDRIFVAGGAATVTRSSWTEEDGTTFAVAWEVYPVRPQLTTYILPFGEDLANPVVTYTYDFLDEFETVSFGNNDGTLNWAGDWVEYDDAAAGPAGGRVQITGGELMLYDETNSIGEPSAAREMDLSSYNSASLSFDFRNTAGVDTTDSVVVEISDNGGTTYTVLEDFTGIAGTDSGSRIFDISGYISSNTRIRFRVNNLYGGANEFFYVDNVSVGVSADNPPYPSMDDFDRVFALIQATSDSTTITVDFDGDGNPDKFDTNEDGNIDDNLFNGEFDLDYKDLNPGETYLLETTSGIYGQTLDTGTIIEGTSTLQVQYIIGDEGSNFENRGLSAFPRGLWDDEYYAPVDGAAAATNDPTDIYLHNPHDTELTITYETTASMGSYTINPHKTRSFFEATGSYVPQNSAVYMKGSAVFWGISTIDTSASTHDWGYSLVPAFLLENEHFLGWAPGSFPAGTGGDADNSGIFIAPAADNIRVFVDFNNDGTADKTYDLDRLETVYVYDDTDGDLSEANIWATGPYVVAYGQNPDTSPTASPAIDVGYTSIPGGDFIEKLLTVNKTTSTELVQTDAGSQSTYKLVVDTYDFSIDGIDITDTLPPGWQYVDGSTTMILADKTEITGNPADPVISGGVSILTWDRIMLGDMAENQSIIIEFTAETTQSFNIGDLTRNIVEARGTRTIQGVTQDFVTTDFVYNSYGNMEINKSSNATDPLSPGDQYTYTVTITNPSTTTGNITGISIYDPMPEGISYVSGTSQISIPVSFRDELTAQTYDGTNGSIDWGTSPWSEINDDTDPTGGRVRVVTDSGDYSIRIRGRGQDTIQRGVVRSADLSTFSDATLNFEYRRGAFNNNTTDYVDIQVRAAGAPSWTLLERITGPADDSTYLTASYDISSHISNDTEIRFLMSGGCGGGDYFYMDDIQISYSNIQAAGDAPNFVSTNDNYILSTGDTLTLTFIVFVDDPLPTGISQVVNTASVSSNEYPLPLNASVTNIVVNPSSQSAEVGGQVWFDLDSDGELDIGETGFNNVEVTLKDQFGTPISIVTTDSSGNFLFTGVQPGNGYWVEVTDGLPTGLVQTAPSGHNDNRTETFDLSVGGSYLDANLGYGPDTDTGVIGDLVWSDADGNGVRDSGEPGLSGISVVLYLDGGDGFLTFDGGSDDTLVSTTTTAADGSYLFAGLPIDGTEWYFAYIDISQGALSDYTLTTNITTPGGIFGELNSLEGDYGFQNTSGTTYSINDRIWFDENSDQEDDGETGISGVTIDLLDSSLNVIVTTTTDSNGYFTFNGIIGGGADYTIAITDSNGVLADFYGTTIEAQNGNMEINNLSGNIDFTIEPDEPNFGYNISGAIGGTVYNDIDGNSDKGATEPGLGGIAVTLYIDQGTIGTLDVLDIVEGTISTDENGIYLFSSLDDGNYIVSIESPPSGFNLTTTDEDLVATGHQRFSSISGGGNVFNMDYGYQAQIQRSVSGRIWEDLDFDGVIDTGETGMEGITIELLENDTRLSIISSDSNGDYIFDGISPGTYSVRVTDENNLLAGYYTTYEMTEGADVDYEEVILYDNEEEVDLTTGDQTGIIFGYKMPVVTAVTLSSFKAYEKNGQVVVEWETASENGTLGFYLKRKNKNGKKFKRVNKKLLPGLMISPKGGTYRYVDVNARPGETYTYQLVEVEVRGKKQKYGPFTITVGQEGIDFSSNTFLSGSTESGYSKSMRKRSSKEKARENAVKFSRKKAKRLKKNKRGTKAKISISEENLYYLKADSIAEILEIPLAKVRKKIKTNRFNISHKGEKVSWLPGEGNGGLIFYGKSIDSIYTGENIYWVEAKKGRKISKNKGDGPEPLLSENTFIETIHVEENYWLAESIFDDSWDDYYLWDYVDAGYPGYDTMTIIFNADGAAAISETAFLTVELKGWSSTEAAPDHHVQVFLNNTLIGEGEWDGLDSNNLSIEFNQELLIDGENEIKITGILNPDVFYSFFGIDSFDLIYHRNFQAVNNRLSFTVGQNEIVTVKGFTDSGINVFDTTDPLKPIQILATTIDKYNEGYNVSFRPGGSDRKFIVFSGQAALTEASLVADKPSKLKNKRNIAEYIIITPDVLKNASLSLADYRSEYNTMVVELEDIYDEFNYGISSPRAIKDFLTHAYHNWKQAPKYIVLAGDGTYDYKNYEGYDDNLMPSMIVSTPEGLFPSDNWFVDVSGSDGVPEMAIGRLPAVTEEELLSMIDKIIAFEAGSGSEWKNNILMLADNSDNGGNFSDDSDDIATWVPADYSLTKIYLSELSISEARQQFFDNINSGSLLVNYIGHSGYDRIADEGLLLANDLSGNDPHLSNKGRLPIFTSMTCLMGQFAIPGFDFLSESLMLHKNGGAISVWAPSGLSLNPKAKIMDDEFFRAVFSDHENILGDAVLKALQGYSKKDADIYMMDIFILFGDPALQIR
jgi:uncharacterized repeat protein (TIGR01451 family)